MSLHTSSLLSFTLNYLFINASLSHSIQITKPEMKHNMTHPHLLHNLIVHPLQSLYLLHYLQSCHIVRNTF